MQIFSNFALNSESESLTERPKRISSKVDFKIIRDPNIPLGLITMRKCFLLQLVIQVLYSLPVFGGYINKVRPSINGVAMKIRKLFSEIETSNESVRTSSYELFRSTTL